MLPSTTSPSKSSSSSTPAPPQPPTPLSSNPKDTPPSSSNPSAASSHLSIPAGNSTTNDYYRRPNRSSHFSTPTTSSTPPSSYNYTPSLHHHHHSHHQHNLHSHMTPQAYLTRLLDIQQMDIQSALDQMKTLCSPSPSRAYKTSYYRKQTKDHWARDDPAFVLLQIIFLCGTSLAYCIAFKVPGVIGGILDFLVKSVVVHYLGWGVIMASVGRWIANEYLSVNVGGGGGSAAGGGGAGGGGGGREIHVKQKVEWLYAFDIHCNAFFPMFVLLYALQFFLLPLVLGNSLFALVLSNTLYAIAFSWYFYITHLGYRALPFLSNTEVFLFPIAAVLGIYVLNLVGYPFGFGWNASRIMAYVFFD